MTSDAVLVQQVPRRFRHWPAFGVQSIERKIGLRWDSGNTCSRTTPQSLHRPKPRLLHSLALRSTTKRRVIRIAAAEYRRPEAIVRSSTSQRCSVAGMLMLFARTRRSRLLDLPLNERTLEGYLSRPQRPVHMKSRTDAFSSRRTPWHGRVRGIPVGLPARMMK